MENIEQLSEEDVLFLNKTSFSELESMEALEKGGSFKCVRCGKPVSSKGGRCRACLAKLKHAKKTPGSWQRAQTQADGALRRNRGENGTAHKKSKNLGSRKKIMSKMRAAEKKTGQKLSLDRKHNSEGYGGSNTRAVPESLNVGRHHVDPKKLAAWKKHLKKNDITPAQLKEMLLAKCDIDGSEDLAEFLRIIDIERLLEE